MIIRRSTLAAVLPATDPKDASQRCNKIEIRPDGTVTATDGHVLLSATEPHPFPDTEYPTKGVPHFSADAREPLYLQATDAKALIKGTSQSKRSGIPILKAVQLGLNGEGPYAAATDNQTVTTVRVDTQLTAAGAFPGWDRIVPPADRPSIKVILSAKVLRTLAAAAEAANDRNPMVAIYVPTQPAYRSHTQSDHTFDGDPINGKGCSCGQEHTGKGSWPLIYGGGELDSAMRIETKGDDVRIVGAMMPCRA